MTTPTDRFVKAAEALIANCQPVESMPLVAELRDALAAVKAGSESDIQQFWQWLQERKRRCEELILNCMKDPDAYRGVLLHAETRLSEMNEIRFKLESLMFPERAK